jgi:hemoglobin
VLPGPPSNLTHPWGNSETPYDEIGGDGSIRALVENFYDIIEDESPVLREMLPADTSGSRQKLYEYLSGWLGGPPLYAEKQGHPKLRMRHLPFAIGDAEAEEWMRCMSMAMTTSGVEAPLSGFLGQKLADLALHMRNQP